MGIVRRAFESDRRFTRKYFGPRTRDWGPFLALALFTLAMSARSLSNDSWADAVPFALIGLALMFKSGFLYAERLRELGRQSRLLGFRMHDPLDDEHATRAAPPADETATRS